MDSVPAGARGDRCGSAPVATPPPPVAGEESQAGGSLCMTCRVRDLCVGGVAADAGTAQLRVLLTGRRWLRGGEALVRQGEPFQFLYAVRSGSLKSCRADADDDRVLGFHLPGDLVGRDGIAAQRHAATLSALEDSELCVLRHGGPGMGAPGMRPFSGRLWDMMSREVLRERAEAACFGGLAAAPRITLLLASLCARMRAHGASVHGWMLPMSLPDLGSRLGLPQEEVATALRSLADRRLLQLDAARARITDPDLLQEEAQALLRAREAARPH